MRPLLVTLIGCLFIATGLLGFAYHLPELTAPEESTVLVLWVLLLRVLAVAGGVALLKGANWARWLLLGWLAYHVIIGVWHSLADVMTHAVLLVVIGYVLTRPGVTAFVRQASVDSDEIET